MCSCCCLLGNCCSKGSVSALPFLLLPFVIVLMCPHMNVDCSLNLFMPWQCCSQPLFLASASGGKHNSFAPVSTVTFPLSHADSAPLNSHSSLFQAAQIATVAPAPPMSLPMHSSFFMIVVRAPNLLVSSFPPLLNSSDLALFPALVPSPAIAFQ